MKRLFAEPEVRLFLSSLFAGGVAFAMKFVDATGHITYSSSALHGAIVAGGLAFAQLFTPLNKSVGLFKELAGDGSVPPPPPPIEPPGDGEGTEDPQKAA